MLILPGNPEFSSTLEALPPNWMHVRANTNGDFALVCRNGLMEAVSGKEAEEYVWGGEMDEITGAQEDEYDLDDFGDCYA